jgi:hypothetical protein
MKNKKTTIEVEFNGWDKRQFEIAFKLNKKNTTQVICNKWLNEMIKREKMDKYGSTIVHSGILDLTEVCTDEEYEAYKYLHTGIFIEKHIISFEITKKQVKLIDYLSSKYNISQSLVLNLLLVQYLELEVQVPNPEFKIDEDKYDVHDEESYVALLKRRGLLDDEEKNK